MTPELQKYYEDRLSMMSSPAWTELIKDVQLIYDTTNTLDGVSDEKTLHFRKGEISMMRWLLSIKEVSEQTYEDLNENPT